MRPARRSRTLSRPPARKKRKPPSSRWGTSSPSFRCKSRRSPAAKGGEEEGEDLRHRRRAGQATDGLHPAVGHSPGRRPAGAAQPAGAGERRSKPGALKNSLIDVCDEIEGGATLSEAMAKCPKAFDRLYVNMIKAGEAGGALEVILKRLAEFQERSQALKRKVKGALVYPIIVVVFAVGHFGLHHDRRSCRSSRRSSRTSTPSCPPLPRPSSALPNSP